MAELARIETDIPQRLDRLPWGRFHTLVAVSLGITWVLDGLEVTIAGAIAAETIGGVAERFEAMNKAPTPPIPGGAALRVPLLALGMAYYSVRDRM